MKKTLFFMLSFFLSLEGAISANSSLEPQVNRRISIIGGGIIGALESYYGYKDALRHGEKICVTVYEKGDSFTSSGLNQPSTNTAYNIVPSLTIDEILSVVPRGSELLEKLAIHFSHPSGIRVDDVVEVNDSISAMKFKEAVTMYGADNNHDDRKIALLMMGKKSMELWQNIYDEGDEELKNILELSNFHPCREPKHHSDTVLHDGYRIDLIYGMKNSQTYALAMKADYEKLGYKHCALLSPDEVIMIDPSLVDFCYAHSYVDHDQHRLWNNDSVALWRPGGCIDTRTFLPKFYDYLRKIMGQYRDVDGQLKECFELQFGSEVTAIDFDPHSDDLRIMGLTFSDGRQRIEDPSEIDSRYVFCPGEAVGTLHRFGFNEPAYAAFAGSSLLLTIPLSEERMEKYRPFSHCMEVHKEGIVLAWQARRKENTLFIGVAGTKAFYGDKQPNKDEEFAKNRNLVQLNIINDVLPESISLACGYSTEGKTLSAEELSSLEDRAIVRRWVGRRAVAYDGFPTIGSLYCAGRKVSNARCTTHLGSGGVAFAPAAVMMSRSSEEDTDDHFIQKVLNYGDSRREPYFSH